MVVGGWVNGRLTSRIDVWDGESWSRTDMPVERGIQACMYDVRTYVPLRHAIVMWT